MRSSLFAFLLAGVFAWSVGLPAEDSAPSSPGQPIPVPAQPTSPAQPIPAQQGSSTPDSASQPRNPNLEAPRSDSVNADALPSGESSSKDTAIDLSPPANDVKAHPESSDILKDAESAPSHGDVSEFHPWNPHKAAKDVEVGYFYFKRKNYRAAEDRYREALRYKDNDAVATIRLASAGSEQSPQIATPPSSRASASSGAARRPLTATASPWPAKRRAQAAPIPLPPPVISTFTLSALRSGTCSRRYARSRKVSRSSTV